MYLMHWTSCGKLAEMRPVGHSRDICPETNWLFSFQKTSLNFPLQGDLISGHMTSLQQAVPLWKHESTTAP